LEKGKVGLYVCGITPYDQVHLGHARCYVVFDVIKRVLKHNGYQVRHIQNYTDVDDKIIERANQKKVSPIDHAKVYIDDYKKWMSELNVSPADAYPLVTENIPVIIDLSKRLVAAGAAYVLDGDVYFSVRKFPAYGRLSNRKIDELEAGARVQIDEKKKDPLDFALWKKSKEGEPSWDSPWGKGRPGWHIECSALSMKYLGEKFDIHGGGQDLIFPHHENEVAQSIGATGLNKGFAQYWIHNGFVTINKKKMSKSSGNFFTMKDILREVEPMAVRYYLLTQHYKSPLNFSDSDLNVAQNTWRHRVVGAYEKLEDASKSAPTAGGTPSITEKEKYVKDFYDSLNNDFNTPAALGALHQYGTWIFVISESMQNASRSFWESIKKEFTEMLDTLGFVVSPKGSWSKDILDLVHARQEARKNKEWSQSDKIRDELKSKGVVVEDTAKGPKIKKI